MQCFRKVTEDLYWVGGNDRQIELFENIFPLAKGVSYNSYLLLDEQTVLFDTADYAIGKQFIETVMSAAILTISLSITWNRITVLLSENSFFTIPT